MNEVIITLIAVWVSFGVGMVLPFLLGRGLFFNFLKAFFTGKILLRVHLQKGWATFKLGSAVPGASMVSFSMNGKKDVRYVSVTPGAIVRAARVNFMDVNENDSSPFVYEKVVAVEKEAEVPKTNEEGKPVLDKDGKEILEKIKYTAYRVFEPWNDNAVIRQLYNWALMRPRRKLPGLGMDLQSILIILAVIVGVVLLVAQIKSGNTSNIIG